MNKNNFDLKLAKMVGALFRPWRCRNTPADLVPIESDPLTVITGATGGIGQALAHELASAGHNLLLLGRQKEGLQALSDALKEKSDKTILTLAVDLLREDAGAFIETVAQEKGFHVACLINNAGLGEPEHFLESDLLMLNKVMDLNMNVLVGLSHHFLSGMVARGKGAVINIASIGGLAPAPYQSIYYATKTFVIAFTESLAHEVRGRGVYVAAILPGPTKTPFHGKIDGKKALYLKVMGQMKPELVARSTHRALLMQHWPIITPGMILMILGLCLRVIPASLLTPLLGLLYKKK